MLYEKQKAKEAFGNGRTVRNLVEMAEKNLAERLEKVGVLASDHGKLSADEYKKALTTVTLEDVKAVQLRGLGQKANKVIDLGGSIPKNDNLQAAAQTKPKAASPK